jgi:hypothetical protein
MSAIEGNADIKCLGAQHTRLREDGGTREDRHDLFKEHEPLGRQFGRRLRQACYVAALRCVTVHKAECERISAQGNHDRDRRGRLLGGYRRRRRPGDDHIDGKADKLINQVRKTFSITLGVAVLHGHILVFDPAESAQAVFESLNEG